MRGTVTEGKREKKKWEVKGRDKQETKRGRGGECSSGLIGYFFLPSSRIKRLETEESFPRERRNFAWLAVIPRVVVYLA